MKRMINASREYKRYEGWDPKDIQLHSETDWEARNYEDLPVPTDSFYYKVRCNYADGRKETKDVEFIKYICANPIFPPYWAPKQLHQFEGAVGPMYDGRFRGYYDIHDRYEDYELYEMLTR